MGICYPSLRFASSHYLCITAIHQHRTTSTGSIVNAFDTVTIMVLRLWGGLAYSLPPNKKPIKTYLVSKWVYGVGGNSFYLGFDVRTKP